MLVRREAFDAVGGFDERFFLYSEEVDLCLRVRRAGWKVVHSPVVTILHHGNSDRPADPRLQAQLAWAQLQYADKHLSPFRGRSFAGRCSCATGSARCTGSRGGAGPRGRRPRSCSAAGRRRSRAAGRRRRRSSALRRASSRA